MLETYLTNHHIVLAIIWVVLYTGDYYLTLWGNKLFRAQSIIRYEGSYEMQPEYQDDIDKMRKISPSFVIWLLVGAGVLLLPCPDVEITRKLYAVLAGALIVPELVAHIRHAENVVFWRRLGSKSPGVTGTVCYSNAISYRRSAWNTLGIGLLILTAAALGSSFMLLGGGSVMLVTSFTHYQFSRISMAMQDAAAAADSKPDSEAQSAEPVSTCATPASSTDDIT